MISSLGFVTAFSLLLLQGAPAAQPAPKASISGMVVNGGTGTPVAGVRVTVARTDSSQAAQALADQLASEQNGPPVEMAMPAEFFEAAKAQMALGLDPDGTRRDDPDLPPEAALFNSLPLETAHSILISPNGKIAIIPKNALPIVTDGGGRFAFDNLDPGTYRLIFTANGFVRQDYGQALTSGTPIVVEAGQAMVGLVMKVTPTGAISGRIVDGSGQPVAAAPVQLARLAYDAKAKKTAKTIASTETDDRGEYRFYYLTPGRYYLSAGGRTAGPANDSDITDDIDVDSNIPTGAFGLGGTAFGLFGPRQYVANRVPQNFSVSFYRGAPDLSTATPIDVTPGADLADIDVAVGVQNLYTVRGWIVDAVSGKSPGSAFINMLPTEGDEFDPFGDDSPGNQRYDATTGTFELRNVRPGSYVIMANLPDWNPGNFPEPDERLLRTMSPAEQQKYFESMEAAAMAAEAERPTAAALIMVGNADVDGVTLRVGKGVSIPGRLRVETRTNGRAPALNRVRVALTGASPALERQQFQPIKPDGVFSLDGIIPGEYGLIVNGLPAGFYVKSARWGDLDALNAPLTLSAEKRASLEIIIASGMGQVDGTVTGSDARPASGAQVVLIPDKNRARPELFRPVTAGANGKFSISNIIPGDYHLVSWESLEPYGYFDPALIQQAEEKGKAVRIGESSKQTVDVRTAGGQ